MMAVSVDRYLTVKNYRPAGQVARRRYLLTTAVVLTWITAAILSGTQLISKHPWKRSLIVAHVILVYVLPACAVLISHLGVHAKLTALSLTARAKHGELPLPMPLLRRPTHVIIVAGIPKVIRYSARSKTTKNKILPARSFLHRLFFLRPGEYFASEISELCSPPRDNQLLKKI
jgi:hypothetical protein